MSKVTPGLTAKEVAELHYKLLEENNQEEWLKTLETSLRSGINIYGSSAYFWWKTGRETVDKMKNTYKFKEERTKYHTETNERFFFHRLTKDGQKSGFGQVPISVVKDSKDNNEWRVDSASY